MYCKQKASLIALIAAIALLFVGCDCGKGGGDNSGSTSDSTSVPIEIIEPTSEIEIEVKTKEYGSENGTVNDAIERAYSAVYELKATSPALEVLCSAVAVFNAVITQTDAEGVEESGDYTYFATCLSLIEGATDFTLTSPTGEKITAYFVGADPNTDIALLSAEGRMTPVEFIDDSGKVQLTDQMFVIGIPFNAGAGVVRNTYLGAKEHSVIIGSSSRNLMTVSDELDNGYTGGAAYVKNGGVFVGMIADVGDVETNGYTFVIPSRIVCDISVSLAQTQTETSYGFVEGSYYLGAVFGDSKMSSSPYVYVSSIDDAGCLYKGGLRELDKITRVAYVPYGESAEKSFIEVTSSSQVAEYINALQLKIGDKLLFKCIRGGLSTLRSVEITQYIYGETEAPPADDDE